MAFVFIYGFARAAEKGTVPICAKHPQGRSGKWGLSPFRPLARNHN
jgi:hypothetical protein